MDIKPQPPTVAIVGLGLIGGSLALATHALGIPTIGWSRDKHTRDAATAAGLRVSDTLDAILNQLNELDEPAIVVIATPLSPALQLLPRILAATNDQVTVTDVVSVKSPLCEAAADSCRFVGAHPMAGTTESGFGAAHADLLQGARWAVTLDERTEIQRAAAVMELAIATGGTITPLTSEQHDRSVAWISHLPHLIAETLAAGANWQPALGLGAGSFRDATRIAGTRPELVEQMIGANPYLADTLREYIDHLEQAHAALSAPDQLLPLLQAGHAGRSRWELIKSDTAPMLRQTIELDHSGAKQSLLYLGQTGGYLISCDRGLATALVCDPDAPLTGE